MAQPRGRASVLHAEGPRFRLQAGLAEPLPLRVASRPQFKDTSMAPSIQRPGQACANGLAVLLLRILFSPLLLCLAPSYKF